ncbi:MAG: reverse gyrase, partial [Pyrodictiaceae archaeon]
MSISRNDVASLKPTGIYLASCPNCGGPIADDRLLMRLPCPKCLPEKIIVRDITEAARELKRRGVLKEGYELAQYARVIEESREVESLFEKALGSKPWSAQRSWIRRVLKGKSFAIIAPTGVGKTTFGVLMAIYLASKGLKSYIVLPTTPLVEMVEKRAELYSERVGKRVRILAIHSRLRGKERLERTKRLREGDFDVLITTSRFLQQHVKELVDLREKGAPFHFIFVDDVDAVLKSSKSIDSILRVTGFNDSDIEAAWQLLRLRRELPRRAQEAQKKFSKELEKLRNLERRRKGVVTADEIRALKTKIVREYLGELYEKLRELEDRIRRAREKASILVVSSATGRPRGSRVKLFSILLGFQAGSRSEVLRNIVDIYTVARSWDEIEQTIVSLAKKLGSGGLVYVPVDKGTEYAEKLARILQSAGVRAEPFTSKNIEALERFQRGETDVLVGVAIYYGVAVRGLDLPERIRYAIFAGVPRLKFSARFEDPHPLNIIRALAILAENAPEDVSSKAETLLAKTRRAIQKLSQAALSMIAEELKEGKPRSEYSLMFQEALEFIRSSLMREDVWRSLEKAPDIAIIKEDDKNYILIPDVATYIQASGRTSRLVAGGLTKGLSIVVADNHKLLEGLMKRSKWYTDTNWVRIEEANLEEIMAEIDKDRRRVKEILEGKVKPEVKEMVKTALLIVESPNKARTIANFFGRPSIQELGPLRVYEVSTGDITLLIAASGGHVYDLVKPYEPTRRVDEKWLMDLLEGSVDGFDWSTARNIEGIVVAKRGEVRYLPVYAPIMRCMVCGHQWTLDPTRQYLGGAIRCPNCGSTLVKSSLDIVNMLRDVASEVDMVLIGTDPDTEGEKIGWDIAALIAPAANKILRVEFHEITRRAITRALREARRFNKNLIQAQIVRRVEDRWIGFSLSPILWSDFWRNYCEQYHLAKIKKLLDKLYERKREEQDKRSKLREETIRGIENNDIRKALGIIERYKKRSNASNMRESKLDEVIRILEEEKKKIEEICNKDNYNLSAGRVQTPVLGWIVEHTLHYKFEKQTSIYMELEGPEGGRLEVEVQATEYDDELKKILKEISSLINEGIKKYDIDSRLREVRKLVQEAKKREKAFRDALKKDLKAEVEVLSEEEVEVKPLPPFTTDVMLSEASAKFGLGAPEIMRLAQDLFELGFITYHRTDSTRVSDTGINVAREYLQEKYGSERLKEYFVPRSWGEGGAHEAIRPTRPIDAERLKRLIDEGIIQTVRPLTKRHFALYDLIFRRFIASQMRPARLVKQKIKVKIYT